MPLQLHLIWNSHLDPVWLWDWREGLGESLTTIRTILDLMDEYPDMSYIRGESAIYRHLEKSDPGTFKRIVGFVKSRRWDIVGGTYIQSDTNLPATESLVRQYARGLDFFQSRFGVRPTVAWQADSFGHTAGLPEILASAGMDSLMFTRPGNRVFPLREPAFWWKGEGGARILGYQPQVEGYNTERDNTKARLDEYVRTAAASQLQSVACLCGLGNHGGGPTRRHLADVRAWAKEHPEVQVIHSGLHRFFAALRLELNNKPADFIPTHCGEIQYWARGCYSSVAKFKYLYRKSENLLSRAEATGSAISALTLKPGTDLSTAWDGILFNAFHDILPGSSIERAFDDQIAWLGSVIHTAQGAEFEALTALAERVDSTVRTPPPDHPSGTSVLVWNPHPHPFAGQVEIEISIDYRPVWKYKGRASKLPLQLRGTDRKPVAFQEIATEHSALPHLPWRKRIVTSIRLPALGWNVLELGWVEGAKRTKVKNPVHGDPSWIENKFFRLEAAVGDPGIRLFREGRPVFAGNGLAAAVFEDPWGSWGGMNEEPESVHLTTIRESWTVTHVELLEKGPERAKFWVRLGGARSRIDLTFALGRGRDAVDVSARVFWDERSARLKLMFPVGDEAEFEVPGAIQKRKPRVGQVPGGRWVRVGPATDEGFGFASDALYDFDCGHGKFSATVVRATRYANDVVTGPEEKIWYPAVDAGELRFQFVMAPGSADLAKLSRELEKPPIVHVASPSRGDLPRRGSLASLHPSSLNLLALKRAEDGVGWVLRVQASVGRPIHAKLKWLGTNIPLGILRGGQIGSWRLSRRKSGWHAEHVDSVEHPI